MRIELLESVENTGIILDVEKVIRDEVVVECAEDGVLMLSCVGFGDRAYPIKDGKTRILDYNIAQGPSKARFINADGKVYNLGVLVKNNRFLTVQNPIDEITVKLALGLEEEKRRADAFEKRLRALEKEFGINVLEV